MPSSTTATSTTSVARVAGTPESPLPAALSFADKLQAVTNNAANSSLNPAGVKQDPQDIKGLLLGMVSGLASAAFASQAGLPLLGAALTYGLTGLSALWLGRHVQTEEVAETQNRVDKAKLADDLFQAVLGVFNADEQEILNSRLEPHLDQLDLTTVIANLGKALDNRQPRQTVADILSTLPVKAWVRAGEHKRQVDRSLLELQERQELRRLKDQEYTQALEFLFAQLIGQGPRITAGSPVQGSRLAQYARAVEEQRAFDTQEQLSNWQTPRLSTMIEGAHERLEARVKEAKENYNAARSSPESSPEEIADARQEHQALKIKWRTAELNLQIQTTQDPETKADLIVKLDNARERHRMTQAAGQDAQAYLKATDPQNFSAGTSESASSVRLPGAQAEPATGSSNWGVATVAAVAAAAAAPISPPLSMALALAALASPAESAPLPPFRDRLSRPHSPVARCQPSHWPRAPRLRSARS